MVADMRKKLVVVFLTCVLCFGMALPTFAAWDGNSMTFSKALSYSEYVQLVEWADSNGVDLNDTVAFCTSYPDGNGGSWRYLDVFQKPTIRFVNPFTKIFGGTGWTVVFTSIGMQEPGPSDARELQLNSSTGDVNCQWNSANFGTTYWTNWNECYWGDYQSYYESLAPTPTPSPTPSPTPVPTPSPTPTSTPSPTPSDGFGDYVVTSFDFFLDVLRKMVTYMTTNTDVFGVPIGYVVIYFGSILLIIRNFVNKGDSDGKS